MMTTDPIADFRQMDTNFDAYVDSAELLAGTPEWKRSLAKSVFPGFDLDRDGRLTLSEYRMTMQANMILPWHRELVDQDGGGLTTAEFRFERRLFPLLVYIYFRRLDTNSNGVLDPTEFAFKTVVADEFGRKSQ